MIYNILRSHFEFIFEYSQRYIVEMDGHSAHRNTEVFQIQK